MQPSFFSVTRSFATLRSFHPILTAYLIISRSKTPSNRLKGQHGAPHPHRLNPRRRPSPGSNAHNPINAHTSCSHSSRDRFNNLKAPKSDLAGFTDRGYHCRGAYHPHHDLYVFQHDKPVSVPVHYPRVPTDYCLLSASSDGVYPQLP